MKKYDTTESRIDLARCIATEAIVLLKNDDKILPLKRGSRVALFGRTQNEIIIGGGGSGASKSDNVLVLIDELVKAGLKPDGDLAVFYKDAYQEELKAAPDDDFDMDKLAGLVSSGLIYELFGKYNAAKSEPIPDAGIMEKAGNRNDVAIYILGRATGGEECDRHRDNDYYLTESEKELVTKITDNFNNVIVVLNVNGLVDMTWVNNYPQIKAVLFMGTLGEQAAGALADILSGAKSPSGKLSQTAALRFEDYPSSQHFSYSKDDETGIKQYLDYGLSAVDNKSIGFDISPVSVYVEDVYVGYKYFKAFDKSVLYPFGFGLSYAEFEIKPGIIKLDGGKIKTTVTVTNKDGNISAREVIQVYVNKVSESLYSLKAFAKTGELRPGEAECVDIAWDISDLATFIEAQKAYVIEKGTYTVHVGNSADSTVCVGRIDVDEDIIAKRVKGNIGLNKANVSKIEFLKAPKCNKPAETENIIRLTSDDLDKFALQKECDSEDAGSIKNMAAKMSIRELAVLCCGYGPGLPFGGIGSSNPSTIKDEDGNDIAYNSHMHAMPGYVSPAIDKYGIKSCYYKDGPASVGLTAWPTGMMLSCTFNTELLYEFGHACASEAEILEVASWLAPGLNIIRNPIEGRAFEYFSEDPYLCGACGVAISKGAMENNNVTVCPKHFALNEQETFRRGSRKKNIDAVDTIVSERAAREVYLKPFEMVVTKAKPRTIMTSFNKINGTFAAGNYELNTVILRDEWEYDGVVVTDWGDMDIVVDGADAVAAGNDVIMPGGPPVIEQILKGYDDGRVTREQLETAVIHLMRFVGRQ